MDKDSKGQRNMEDSGGGLLPAVEGHSLEQNTIGLIRFNIQADKNSDEKKKINIFARWRFSNLVESTNTEYS